MNQRILATPAAVGAAQKMRTLVAGSLSDQLRSLLAAMRSLSSPAIWDGPEAGKFRRTVPSHTAGLTHALQALERIGERSDQVLHDIMSAGSQGSFAGGGAAGPAPAVPVRPGFPGVPIFPVDPVGEARHAWDGFWHWANTPVDAPHYGEMAASAVNLFYGSYKLATGVPLLVAGSAATVSVPFIGQLAGPPAVAYGAYQTITGGVRMYRGARQEYDVLQHPIVHESPLQQGRDFVFGVIPFGSKIEGVLGGLP